MTSSTTRKQSAKAEKNAKFCLSENVKSAMENYFTDLDGYHASNLYELVMSQVEKPLFEIVLKNTKGNMSRAAELLGMNRGTLRSRLKKYGLDR